MYSLTFTTALAAFLTTTLAAPLTVRQQATAGKRGALYNDASAVDSFKSSCSWGYNWASTPGRTDIWGDSLEYVPQLHSQEGIGSWAGDVDNAVANFGTKHVMSFNEPDMPKVKTDPYTGITYETGGTEIDAGTAAGLYQQNVASLKSKHPDLKLGAPGVSSSADGREGLTWLSDWAAACAGNCPVDFVPIHFYGETGKPADYQFQNLKGWLEGTALPKIKEIWPENTPEVWLTEFGFKPDNDGGVADYMNEALPYLESSESGIAKYAYFKADFVAAAPAAASIYAAKAQ